MTNGRWVARGKLGLGPNTRTTPFAGSVRDATRNASCVEQAWGRPPFTALQAHPTPPQIRPGDRTGSAPRRRSRCHVAVTLVTCPLRACRQACYLAMRGGAAEPWVCALKPARCKRRQASGLVHILLPCRL